jgi:cell division protein DivIC
VDNVPFHRMNDNILQFRRTSQDMKRPKSRERKHGPLHPIVRRRRLVWLGVMVLFFCWTVVELIVQQTHIWDREKILAARKMELADGQRHTKELKEEIKRLHDEKYLLELAHKMGFGKPGEEVYSTGND